MLQLELTDHDCARTLQPRVRRETTVFGFAHADPQLRVIAVLPQ